MYHTQIRERLHANMFGGRPKSSTGDAIISHQILPYLSMYKRSPTTIISLDESKCFDRIFPVTANIVLQYLGASPNVGIVLNKVLCGMKHQVRTAYRISNNFITPLKDEIWTGVGQGGGSLLPCWLGLQAIMITAIQALIPEIPIYDPTKCIKIENGIIGYIDDTNIVVIHEGKESKNKKESITQMYNKWKSLLREGSLSQTNVIF